MNLKSYFLRCTSFSQNGCVEAQAILYLWFSYMIRQLLLLIAVAFLGFQPVYSQYTQVGQGLGQNGANAFGPMSTLTNSPLYNRHAYIYPAASIAGLLHGDTIRSIEFKRSNNDTILGSPSFKIYMKNVVKDEYGSGSINWLSEARDSGMTLVYSGNPKESIGNKAGFVRFDFNQSGYYVFDTSGNATNLEILVEYTQTTNQLNASLWFVESNNSVSGFQSNNEVKYISGGTANWLDSITTGSSIFRPTIRLNHPRYNTQLEVKSIYALGTVPILMNMPDTVKAIVRNVGRSTVYNHKVYLEVSGSNTFKDSVYIDSIFPYEEQMVKIGTYSPINTGAEVLDVILDSDDVNSDNQITKSRVVNYNEYSHIDPYAGNSGGIGFNGSTGDFVGKFYVNGESWINQIKVDFSSTGRSFQLVVWDDDGAGGGPGTELFVSDTQQTNAGTFVLPVLPRIKVEGGYYVGIRQTTTTNVAFTFQYERPIRPHTFYFAAPAGDTTWVPFDPGFDYNFNISPRLQVANDLAVTEFINPMNGDSMRYSTVDSLYPSARVVNYGFVDQTNFEVKLEIRDQSFTLKHSDSRIISLPAGKDTVLTFDAMSLFAIGNFTAKAYVNLNIDSVKDNNEAQIAFSIIKRHDVAADLIFEPSNNDSFEINDEGFWPQVRIINYGSVDQSFFPVRIRLVKDNKVIESQLKIESLPGNGGSKILVFDSIFLPEPGWYTFMAYTDLWRDSFRINDTAERRIFGKVSNDVGVLSILNPQTGVKVSTKVNIQPFVSMRNHGLLKQDSIFVAARIYNSSGQEMYGDTIRKSLNFFSTGQVIFPNYFTGSDPGFYKMETEIILKGDQLSSNDTLTRWFEVVDGRDIVLEEMLVPWKDSVYVDFVTVRPKVTIRNNGLVNASDVPIVFHAYNDTGALVFADTVTVPFVGQFDTITVEPNNWWFFLAKGASDLYFVNIWDSEDQRSANDSLYFRIVLNSSKDLAITDHLNPKHLDSIPINTGLIPRIRIANDGLDTLYDIKVAIQINSKYGSFEHKDTLSFDELEFKGKADISGSLFTIPDTGVYEFVSEALINGDYPVNNSISTIFYAIRDIDISVDSLIAFKSPVEIKKLYKPQVYISNKGLYDHDQAINVYCRVELGGDEIYYKFVSTKIDSGEVQLIEFDSTLNSFDVGMAEMTFFVNVFDDRVELNDTLRTTFLFEDKSSITSIPIFNLNVYPNPFDDQIGVRSELPVKSVIVRDELGRTLKEADGLSRTHFEVDLNVSAGVYYITVLTESGQQVFKLIKL
ncbi:T9SS type A sorting domain-containing protein [bacterium]|nr:T9SS type A sorting domain-containing protein [bacterium]